MACPTDPGLASPQDCISQLLKSTSVSKKTSQNFSSCWISYVSLFLEKYLSLFVLDLCVCVCVHVHARGDHFKNLFWICYHVAFFVYFLVFWPCGMRDLSCWTRDRTSTLCIGRPSLNHWTARKVPTFPFWLNKQMNQKNIMKQQRPSTSCLSPSSAPGSVHNTICSL